MSPTNGLPVVAIVGRPNVGKSSLVNRVIGRREAIVEATPGVTRDRSSFFASWRHRDFEVVDTGGLEPGARGLEARVAEQAQLAMEYADVILLVVDASAGLMQDDFEVAQSLRRTQKPVLLVANKVDDASIEADVAGLYRLGMGDPIPVSALHGRGSGDLLDEVVKLLPRDTGEEPTDWAAIAIVGRPNVGKSSLLNALAGETRALVDPTPGTTRDPVDTRLQLGDRTIRVVDTAGMRRQVLIKDPLEYFSFLRSRRTLARVDAAVLVIDSADGVTSHDQRLAEAIVESGRACVIALNKWDLVTKDETDRARSDRAIEEGLRFIAWARFLRVSALTKRGVDRVLPALEAAITAHRTRIPTAELNRILADAQLERPAPRSGGRATRILYGAQADVAPPRVVLFATRRLGPTYLRYLEHRLRAVAGFEGTPVKLEVRLRSRREVERS